MPRRLSIQKTVFPFDYDRNNQKGFNEWAQYIHEQVHPKQSAIAPMKNLINEAKQLLSK